MAGIDYTQKIPNNVHLADDKRLQRALEKWQPLYLQWWHEMGPTDFSANDIYLRTAVSVESSGWAHFDYVKMPDYRWGIFLEPALADRAVSFGDNMGQEAWQEVPGEFRNELRRIIVTQADTEPASVEQQRLLGHTAPSLYDLRNLFQVNVEEGRHLWAMVYLLHRYFGKDGRNEAEELLDRRSGNPDRPRILGTFNEPITTWLDFFMFAMFTDRDGKFQLLALAESGFDPLSRTCKFMLTEEAHHLFVGQTGIGRVIKRTCELMNEYPDACPSERGAIPLAMIQRYINYWASSSTDLYGAEVSSNAANYFAAGLKGRAYEGRYDEHTALQGSYEIERLDDSGKLMTEEVPLRNAMNEVLRSEYIADNQKGIDYWNRILTKQGISDFEFSLPHRRFNRSIGLYTDHRFSLEGDRVDDATWEANQAAWLPTEVDRQYVASLMKAVYEPGQFAGWIAPPPKGVNGKEEEFEYVKL